jgi:hypothetical protein
VIGVLEDPVVPKDSVEVTFAAELLASAGGEHGAREEDAGVKGEVVWSGGDAIGIAHVFPPSQTLIATHLTNRWRLVEGA